MTRAKRVADCSTAYLCCCFDKSPHRTSSSRIGTDDDESLRALTLKYDSLTHQAPDLPLPILSLSLSLEMGRVDTAGQLRAQLVSHLKSCYVLHKAEHREKN